MPGVAIDIRYAAQSHCRSGVWVLWRTVPAVNEVWWQVLHSQVLRVAKDHAPEL